MAGRGGKEFPLSLTIRSIDRATSGIKRINDALDRQLDPARRLSKEFGRLHKNLGIPKIASGLRSIATGLGVVAGAAVGAVYGFKQLVDGFDELGDKAEAIGVPVDTLAQLRFAADEAGGSVEALDSSLGTFNKNVGQVKAGTGRLTGLLKRVSPALLKQMKGANGAEEAFNLLADAMAKLEDPAKRAALAAAAGFDESLIPLLARGSKGVQELRDQFQRTAGSQEQAAAIAGKVDSAWRLFGTAIQGVKASLLTGLGPAFEKVLGKATAFISENSGKINEWVTKFGQELPDKIRAMLPALELAKDAFGFILDSVKFTVQGILEAKDALDRLAGADEDLASAAVRRIAEERARMGGATPQEVIAAGNAAVRAKGGAQVNRGGAQEDEGLSSVGGGVEGVKTRLRWLLGTGDKFLLGDSVFQATDRLKRSGNTAMPDIFGSPAGGGQTTAKIEVEFKNAPPGTRTKTDPRSTADVELNTGYQLGLAP